MNTEFILNSVKLLSKDIKHSYLREDLIYVINVTYGKDNVFLLVEDRSNGFLRVYAFIHRRGGVPDIDGYLKRQKKAFVEIFPNGAKESETAQTISKFIRRNTFSKHSTESLLLREEKKRVYADLKEIKASEKKVKKTKKYRKGDDKDKDYLEMNARWMVVDKSLDKSQRNEKMLETTRAAINKKIEERKKCREAKKRARGG